MRITCWALLCLSTSAFAPARLQSLLNSVKEFASKESSTANQPSSEIRNRLIESAVKFANNEGQELDNFVDVLTTVCQNNIAQCDIDRLSWDVLERLFQQRMTESVSQGSKGRTEIDSLINPAEQVTGKELSNSAKTGTAVATEEQLNSPKRRIDSENTRQVKSRLDHSGPRESVESILKHVSSIAKPFVFRVQQGADLLNYWHYKLVERGDYERILYHLKLLGASEDSTLYMIHLFRDAYRKLQDPSFEVRNPELEEGLRTEENFLARPVSRDTIVNRLRRICTRAGDVYKPPFGIVKEMEENVFELSHRTDLRELQFVINLYENAGFSFVKKRTLFQRSLGWLETGTQ